MGFLVKRLSRLSRLFFPLNINKVFVDNLSLKVVYRLSIA